MNAYPTNVNAPVSIPLSIEQITSYVICLFFSTVKNPGGKKKECFLAFFCLLIKKKKLLNRFSVWIPAMCSEFPYMLFFRGSVLVRSARQKMIPSLSDAEKTQ